MIEKLNQLKEQYGGDIEIMGTAIIHDDEDDPSYNYSMENCELYSPYYDSDYKSIEIIMSGETF